MDFIRPKSAAERHHGAAADAVTGEIVAVVFKARRTLGPRDAAASHTHPSRAAPQVSDRGHIGYATPGGARRYCCSAAVAEELGCTPGAVVVTPHADDASWPWTTRITFRGDEEVALAADTAVTIRTTGMYHLWFLTCDASLAATAVAGHTAWKNPEGYLPGMMAPNLPFFGAMSAAYVVLGVIWMAACAAAWRHVIALQHCISVVLLLGMAEMLTWYVDYADFNDSGFRPYSTTVAAVLLGAARKTLARALLLVAALGFGVVRPTLGDAAPRVVALVRSAPRARMPVTRPRDSHRFPASQAGAYFCATCGLDVTTHVGAIDDLTSSTRVFLVAPVAALDAVFILWTFAALSSTLGALAARRAAPKLELYRRFTNALAGAVVVSIAWIGYEMYFKLTDAHNAHWRSDWVTAAFWHVLNMGLVAAMCATWRPGDAVAQFVRGAGEQGAEDRAPEKGEHSARPGGGGSARRDAPFTLDDAEDGAAHLAGAASSKQS